MLLVSHNLPTVLSLCTKGILLDNGEIKIIDDIENVVNVYLNENIRLDGKVMFSNNHSYFNRELKFVSAHILDTEGNTTAFVSLIKGFILSIEYKVSKPLRLAQVAFELCNSTGLCVLSSTDLDGAQEIFKSKKIPGLYRASCFIPSDYLRPGRYIINLSSSIPRVKMLDDIQNAIAFEVIDTGGVEIKLAQGRRGIVCPLLLWKTELLEQNNYK